MGWVPIFIEGDQLRSPDTLLESLGGERVGFIWKHACKDAWKRGRKHMRHDAQNESLGAHYNVGLKMGGLRRPVNLGKDHLEKWTIVRQAHLKTNNRLGHVGDGYTLS